MVVYVITHKKFDYALPRHYQPLLVGAALHDNPDHYLADDTGENISAQNKQFSELTGLYWIWKHSQSNQIGLVHYRRYFYSKDLNRHQLLLLSLVKGKGIRPISEDALSDLLVDYDWVVPHPEEVEGNSLADQYAAGHNKHDLVLTEQAIKRLYPQSLSSFYQVMNGQSSMSAFNMFYTSRSQLDAYCQWLFGILFDVQKHIDLSAYDAYQQRVYGFLSERLFNVWLASQKGLKVKYLSVYNVANLNRKVILRRMADYLHLTKHKKWVSN